MTIHFKTDLNIGDLVEVLTINRGFQLLRITRIDYTITDKGKNSHLFRSITS